MNLNFAFFGTSTVATTVLDELALAGYLPSLIITMPDAPVGRKRVLTPPPVKLWAEAHSIPVEQPTSLKNLAPKFEIRNLKFEILLVVDYGKLIPKSVLDIPKQGSLNVHVSLLPQYRGPSPMQTALLDGATKTGVTIMEVVEGLDEGAIVATETIDLATWKPTFQELAQHSAHIGGKLLVKILPDYLAGKIKGEEQDHSKATYTKKFTAEDAFIEAEVVLGKIGGEKAKKAEQMVRALNPEPGTWTEFQTSRGPTSVLGEVGPLPSLRLKILKAHIEGGTFSPDLVIPAGKKEMPWQDFLRGNKL